MKVISHRAAKQWSANYAAILAMIGTRRPADGTWERDGNLLRVTFGKHWFEANV